MPISRRNLLKTLGSTALMGSLFPGELFPQSSSKGFPYREPINIVIARNVSPFPGREYPDFSYRLTRAILETLETHFGEEAMPVWGKPFPEVELEKRVTNIIHWVLRAVRQYRDIYPVDPVWVMAQIMKESYFHEFAISASLAVGICQLVQSTAQSHGLVVAGSKPAHGQPPFRLPEFAGKAGEYYRLRRERRRYARANRPAKRFTLEEALAALADGATPEVQRMAARQLSYRRRLTEYDRRIGQARDDFREYLRANVEGRDIFNPADVAFLIRFDERFTYRKPVFAMVKMLAEALRARHGNVLAATAAYNAGLRSTADIGMYEPYGKIPFIEETVTHVSHVLINYHEIYSRL